MHIKNQIKKIIGAKGVTFLKTVNQEKKYITSMALHTSGCINTEFPYRVYEKENSHLFFGYYDLQQFNVKQDKLLAHAVPINKDACKVPIDICWIDRVSGSIHTIAQSKAWCWQQETRLRWLPGENDYVMFNDVGESNYCAKIYDIEHNSCKCVLPCALYDVTPDLKKGLSINFSRLQRLRPGYGYSSLPDKTESIAAPSDDGIFLLDIESQRRTLIISLKQLADEVSVSADMQHYINHVSISPDGTKFMFFHLWTKNSNEQWKNRLCVADIDGNNLRCLETEGLVSHYCWKNNDEILITWSKGGYFIYNIKTGERKHYDHPTLQQNGHPSYFRDRDLFVTDTYPQEKSMQQLFMDNASGDGYKKIASLYSDPRLFDEKRCDLHPRLSRDESAVTVDSTFKSKKRSIIEFKLK